MTVPASFCLLVAFLLTLYVPNISAYGQGPPKGLQFLGVGYNLLKGNPEGGDLSNGGIDPGLLFTRKVLKLSYDTNKLSVGQQYMIPDQVTFAPKSSGVTTTKKEVFSGSKSYQKKLSVDVSANGGYDNGLWNFAFTLSSSFREGYIRWDDENTDDDNSYRGTLPDGKYGDNTLIKYCCRADGHATIPIILPTDRPFVLFKANSHQCQEVQGMRVREEWFKWDTGDWSFSGDSKGGWTPYGEVDRNIILVYCYYYR